MPNYLIIGKNNVLRTIRDRGPKTMSRFPDFTLIASGDAKCVADAKVKYNQLKTTSSLSGRVKEKNK